MKTIIAGCRAITDPLVLRMAIRECPWRITEVVTGGAQGVDSLAEAWARRNRVPVTVVPADWARHGRAAGPIRNRQMALTARHLLAIWNGKSRGTEDMIRQARKLRLRIFVVRVDDEQDMQTELGI